MTSNYNVIRNRLRTPPNAVYDHGIDLKRKLIPPTIKLSTGSGIPVCAEVNIRMLKPELIGPVLPRVVPIKAVERAVCEHYGLTLKALMSPSRLSKVVRPRQVVFYIASRYSRLSLPSIGRRFDRDHTTVLHGIRKIREMVLVDLPLQETVRLLEYMIVGGRYDRPSDTIAPPTFPGLRKRHFFVLQNQTDLSRSSVAAEPQLDLAQEQPVSVSESEIYPVDN